MGRAALLQHGFATIGIIALVDEATGYQSIRARNALEKSLEKFIRNELGKWAKMFPDEFSDANVQTERVAIYALVDEET